LGSCQKGNVSRINGTIQNIDSLVEVKVYRQSFDKSTLVESKKITPKKSKFSIKVGELVEPTFFHLHIEGKKQNVAVLLLEPGDKVTFNVDLKRFSDYEIEGSKESLRTQLLSRRLAQTIKSLDSISNLHAQAKSQDEKTELMAKYYETVEKQREFSTNFIWENPMSRANVMALYQKFGDEQYVFDRPEDTKLFKVVATSIIALYPESSYAIGMKNDIKNQEKLIATHNLQTLIQNAESTLPKIALPNPKGDIVRLSSLRGKVILLDFWASSSQASLLENRELLEVYKQFKNKGFEIYQVSFDVEKEPWLAAIESARLPWINVCELSPNGSTVAGSYNVTQIPSNYLIDKNFNIVGKNLYGKDLVTKLKEIL
jgi:peroxiredoxin